MTDRNPCPSFGEDDPRRRTQCACTGVVIEGPCPLHVITENATGPDVDDIARLVRYLREHQIRYALDVTIITEDAEESAEIWLDITEGHPLPEVYFVGPDGTVYDANREAL